MRRWKIATSKRLGIFASAIESPTGRILERPPQRHPPCNLANFPGPRSRPRRRLPSIRARIRESSHFPKRYRTKTSKSGGKGHLADTWPCELDPFAVAFRRTRGPIAWLESVVFSFRMEWVPGRTAMHLRHGLPSARKNLWCFLDASRSTGMSQFLSSARGVLTGLARSASSARFHLLILEGGKIRWSARNSTARRFEAALLELKEASGKSFIIESLQKCAEGDAQKGKQLRRPVGDCFRRSCESCSRGKARTDSAPAWLRIGPNCPRADFDCMDSPSSESWSSQMAARPLQKSKS